MGYKYESNFESWLFNLLKDSFMIKIPISRETKIVDLELDSLDDIELLMSLETKYKIRIEDEEWFKFISSIKTVGDFLDNFHSKIIANSKPLIKENNMF